MRKLGIPASIVLAFAVFAGPVAAAPTPVGTRINVFTGQPTTLTAGAPFYVNQGFLISTGPLGQYLFTLALDGAPQAFTAVVNVRPSSGLIQRTWLFEYLAGLSAGTHTFVGRWFEPCQQAVADGFISGPCANPNLSVLVYSRSLSVTFV